MASPSRPQRPTASPTNSSTSVSANSQPLQLGLIRLPHELQSQLDSAYLLHQLVLRPQAVLPPGKGVLSLYTQARKRTRAAEGYAAGAEGENHGTGNGIRNGNGSGVGVGAERVKAAEIERRVRAQLEGAFWDDALEKLSSPHASIQLSRLQQLYYDVADALSPLLPASDPLMLGLREPMSPTSSPLESALFHLGALLRRLLQICAPVRDPALTALLGPISPPPTARDPNLPKLCLSTVRGILSLAEEMREDLRDARLALMGEKQLRGVMREEAKEEERAVVRAFYEGLELDKSWEAWAGGPDLGGSGAEGRGRRWVGRLMECLGSDRPVQPLIPERFSPPPTTTTTNGSIVNGTPPAAGKEGQEPGQERNFLPPQLLLESPALLVAQNTIQALTIAACLQTLVHPSLPSSPLPSTPTKSTAMPSRPLSGSAASVSDVNKVDPRRLFMERIWTLLSSEIQEPLPRRTAHNGDTQEEDVTSTKLVHLEEEVVSAWKAQRRKRKALHTPRASLDIPNGSEGVLLENRRTERDREIDEDTAAERELRKSVSRLLRTEDPVFKLLRKRLVQALADYVSYPPEDVAEGSHTQPNGAATPQTMRTGRRLPGSLGNLAELERVNGSTAGGVGKERNEWAGKVKGFEGEVLGQGIGELAGELRKLVEWVEEVHEIESHGRG